MSGRNHLGMNRIVLAILIGLALGQGAGARAATVLIAGAGAGTEGDYNSGYPFNTSLFRGGSMRFQQVYGANEFAALPGPQYLTTIAFRADGAYGEQFAAVAIDLRIDLSTTPAGADGLSPTFADNIGPDRRTVLAGAITLSSAATAVAGGTRFFDIVLALTDPFLFDPARGNLLLDIRSYGTTTTTQMDAVNVRADGLSRVVAHDAYATVGAADTVGLVTQFTFQPQPVPLPPALCLLVPALAVLAGLGRGRARR